jgi:ferritin
MLISENLNRRINEEIGRELFASNQYLSQAAYFDNLALKLLAKRFREQAAEEHEHAMKFVDYLMLAGGAVEIPAIDAPRATFSSVEDAVQLALNWEIDITRYINDLMATAIGEKDYAAQDFLRWFVTEQVEEVSTMQDLLKIVQQVGERQIIMVEAYLVHNK